MAKSFVAKFDIAGKPVTESIMAEMLHLLSSSLSNILNELRIKKVKLVCFNQRSFGTELKSFYLLQFVDFSHHV